MTRILRSLALAVGLLFTALPAVSHAAPPPATTPAGKIDINTATADQLKAFPGIGEAYSKRIIDGRPYANKSQLISKGISPRPPTTKSRIRSSPRSPKSSF